MGKKKAKRKKQSNRGNAFTAEKREAMFQVFFKHGTVNSVVKECNAHVQTVIKYRKADNWDHRAEEIKRKAAEKIDNKEAKRIASDMKLIDNTIKVYAACLIGKIKCRHCGGEVEVPNLIPKFSDIDKLLRLRAFLEGSPDSRPEIQSEASDDIEELKRLLQQKKEQLSSLGSNSK